MSREVNVGSSGALNQSEYCSATFLNAPAEACSAFDFSALTGALQSEMFMEEQGSDDKSVADVFVAGVSLSTCMTAYACIVITAMIIFLAD